MPMSRTELYDVLDRFVAGLAANDHERIPWASAARFSENNVLLPPGDGAWGTVTGMDDPLMRFADIVEGQVACFGAFEESGDRALYGLRLKVADRRVAEAELVVARPLDAGTPFLDTDPPPRAEMNEMLAPEDRTPRAQMIALSDGYFSTLQRNDGTLRTIFTPECNRRENGTPTTNNPQPDLAPISALGCADQFRLGYYRFDNWLRGRRFPLVDEEQGVVLAAAFIDHDGKLKRYRMTDGQEIDAFFRRPHSFSLFEAFKVKRGAIAAVEAVFHFVPYRMQSPWGPDGDPDYVNFAGAEALADA